ncbi:nucleotidyltransferase domain-containing protein [Nocardia sp. NBC_01730]|uniref:nucleotidyltransferase domain-containing protein n=1 Tax=Nocardia sp. NBC_01730 TaxID=2975998 RepID=UPI002E1156B1|nr:nucleotidyltransferase domain-containing protein [Nocardia sp. NBC_01730]
MPATDLILAATAGVHDAFGDAPVFSCLTGSTATDSDTPDSDIDLLVVLPNELPVAEAIKQREIFTHNYIRLHTTFERTPDLKWPGEVCYAADLDTAINGGAFDLASGPRLCLCPDDQPYRYWISMSAAGIPLTGSAAFTEYSTRCAATLLNHIEFNKRFASTPTSERHPHIDPPEWAEWRISPTFAARYNARIAPQRSPLPWRRQLREPRQQPRLDFWVTRWRNLATHARNGDAIGTRSDSKR